MHEEINLSQFLQNKTCVFPFNENHKFFFIILFLLMLANCVRVEPVREYSWNQEDGYRWAELDVESSSQTGLEKISSSLTGITFRNDLTDDRMGENRILMNGSGVAAGDINGDGHIDLYFTRIDGPNRLYLNLGGFQFRDVTEESGATHEGHPSSGAVFADVNGDTHLDLLITSVNTVNSLYLNDGTGTFTYSKNSGLGTAQGSMTMALADVNDDGFLDLYITNYRENNVLDVFDTQDLTWENTIADGRLIPPYDDYFTILNRGDGQLPERHEIGRKDELYLNNGDGTFKKIENLKDRFLASDGTPLGLFPDWGLSAKFQDLDGNRLPDLYVNNDFWTPDRIWLNQGGGIFKAIDSLAIRNSSFYSMTVDFSDINKDSHTDIFTVEMLNSSHSERLTTRLPIEPYPLLKGESKLRPRYNRNSMYLNRGDNTYAEISYSSGLEASDWSWATRFLDLDLDGYEDLIIANGFAHDFQNLDAQENRLNRLIETQGQFTIPYIDQFPRLRQNNKIFRNNGDLTFEDLSQEWGFKDADISMGMATADLNNDGVLDVVISRLNDEPAVFKNMTLNSRIAIRLVGESSNTQAVGAKVKLTGGPGGEQTKQISSGGDYLSGSDPMMVFAAQPDSLHLLTITWPDGSHSKLDSIPANMIFEIDQATIKKIDSVPNSRFIDEFDVNGDSPSFFIDAGVSLEHVHHEDEYDDFRVQPLLPHKLSQYGPGLAWIDLDNDNREELIIGSGKGGQTGIFNFSERDGQFQRVYENLLKTAAEGDQTGIVGWKEKERTHLVIGVANYEIGTSRAPSSLHVQIEGNQIVRVDSIPGILSTTGPLAASDYSGDGSQDLFVGGRFLPGQYPSDATSRLFTLENGKFVEDSANSDLLENIGMVTGAIFIDYNLDGHQDLIIATEWGSIKVFQNQQGTFTDKSTNLGFNQYKGLWQGIATGDFNNDGYPDLIVTNLGENSPYQIESEEHPIRIFYGDFNLDRRVDIIESYYDEDIGGYVPRRKLDEYEHLNNILGYVQSYEEFSVMTVAEMLRRDVNSIPYKEANTLKSMVFINEGGRSFTAKPLPPEAQFSAGFYAGVSDFDNDGYEDIFIAQNFFPVSNPQSNPRMDAGRGLWLKGDGHGNFKAVPGHRSGIKVYGEQRGAALGDYNRDGKIDLIVSQNSAETRVFENQVEKEGIRVALTGPPQNHNGIGARIRLIYADQKHGPARTIQAGSGYWSQNSSVQVLGYESQPTGIEVVWHDGHEQIIDITEGQMEYQVVHTNVD